MSYLFQTSICLILFYAGYFLLLKDKSKAISNRVVLLLALLFSVIIPLIHIPVFPKYISYSVSSGVANFTTNELASSSWFNWRNILALIYVFGVAFSLISLFYKLQSVFKLILFCKKEKTNSYTKVYVNKLAISSFLWYIFIPLGKEDEVSKFELEHELAHIKQKHSFDILFLSLLQVVFWFNPILILYKKTLIELHEYLADEYTINSFGKQAYLNFLSDKLKCQFRSQNVLIHNFYSLIKKRVIMMNSKKNFSKWRVFVMFPLLILALYLFSFKSYAVNPNQAIVSSVEYPPVPANLKGKDYDTVFVFNPTTKTEEIKYVEAATMQLDTVFTFDPVTQKETMKIIPSQADNTEVKETSNMIDSIWVFDPITQKEKLYIENRKTGKSVLVK